MSENKIQKEYKSISIFKRVDKINGIGKGIISTPDIDLHNDIVLPEAINELELKGLSINIDHNENREVGVILDGWKDNVQTGSDFKIIDKEAKKMMSLGNAGLSIEYHALQWEDNQGNIKQGTRESNNNYTGVRKLKEIKMIGLAMTMMPSNKHCKIIEFKSANTVSVNQYPIAPYNAEFINQKEKLKEFFNIAEPNEQFSNCFLWYNDDMPDSFDSYQMQYVGVYDNQLMIFPSAINKINAMLNDFTEIKQDDKQKIELKINDLIILINQDLNKKVSTIMTTKDLYNYLSSVSDLSNSNINNLLKKIKLKNNLTNKNNIPEIKSDSNKEAHRAGDLSASSSLDSNKEVENHNISILTKIHNSFYKQ